MQQAESPVTAIVTNMASVTCPSCRHDFAPFVGDADRRLAGLFPEALSIRVAMEAEERAADGLPRLPGMIAALEGALPQLLRVEVSTVA